MATTTPTTIVVKMTCGTDIRRFSTNSTSFNWASAQKRAVDAFDLTKFKMTYVDDEGDNVMISSDEEVADAVAVAMSNKAVLRLTVTKAEDSAEKMLEEFSKAAHNLPEMMRRAEAEVAKRAPKVAHQLPEIMRLFMPMAADFMGPVLAAKLQAGTGGPCARPLSGAKEGVHEGVICDKSGMSPIVGTRYHLVGHNYDLCQAEFDKLDDKEKALFREIPAPGTEAAKVPAGFHPGVSCDRSGMAPITGMRYNLRGHNYDLCQAEFAKLTDAEKAQYDAIPPPVAHCGPWRGHWRGGRVCSNGKAKVVPGKLGARFIRDVSVFDGTQVAPGTKFTKIWKIKNVGEESWPAGTRMLFVGGDQMTSDMSVPIGRDVPVPPGEEVDVAVEMTAPSELGRYLGYWRLTGPHCHRKWGQRVWCHVQVVDPSRDADAVDVESAMAEFEKMKSNLLPEDAEEDGADEPAVASISAASSSASSSTDPVMPTASEPVDKPHGKKLLPTDEAMPADDAVVVTDTMVAAAQPTAAPQVADVSPGFRVLAEVAREPFKVPPKELSGVPLVMASLKAMGFFNEKMIEAAIAKNGEDIESCATDLAAASEWQHLLDDLAEMGFENHDLNKTLMLKNSGNIKRTVKDLIEA